MVVVHRAHGFRFVIYVQDHEPAHVHVYGSGQAKIEITGPNGEPRTIGNFGIKKRDLQRILQEIEDVQLALLNEWERLNGNLD
jgi:Domain of unknown function (DUF4160)